MAFIKLSDLSGEKKIMIFAEGTILKPEKWYTLYNHNSYVPIVNAAQKIKEWQNQGADMIYCTSQRGKKARDIAKLLAKYGFTGSKLYYRDKKQKYKDIAETVCPDVLIEDNCRN